MGKTVAIVLRGPTGEGWLLEVRGSLDLDMSGIAHSVVCVTGSDIPFS